MIATRDPEPEKTTDPQWTWELIQRLEWRRLEELVAAIVEWRPNFRAELADFGEPGDPPILVYRRGIEAPVLLIRCHRMVPGESPDLGDIEDLRHLMRRSGLDRGVFITPGYFAPGLRHAMRNATDVELLDGANLLELLRSAPDDRTTRALFAIATEGNYWIPTCHQCGSKMKKVEKSVFKRKSGWLCPNRICGHELVYR